MEGDAIIALPLYFSLYLTKTAILHQTTLQIHLAKSFRRLRKLERRYNFSKRRFRKLKGRLVVLVPSS